MSPVPVSVRGKPTTNLLDQAISAALHGDQETALADVGAILEEDPGRAIAMLLLGRLLGELERLELAKRALRVALDLALLEGSLPISIATFIELKRFKFESSEAESQIATYFARESRQLLAHGAVPPALARRRLSVIPAPSKMVGEELMAHLSTLVTAGEARTAELGPEHRVPRHALLSSLDGNGLKLTLQALDSVWIDTGTTVVTEGEPGQEAFIVARGELDVVRRSATENAMVLARLGNGALFGEMALLSRATRAASVVAIRPSLLLIARSDALASVVERQPDVGAVLADYCRRRMVENLLRTSKILGSIEPKERPELVKRFVTRSFEAGERLITQGKDSEGLHLIASGEVLVVHQDGNEKTVVAKVAVGEVVGEISLVLRRPASAHVIASVPTISLHLPQSEFLGVVKRYPELLSHLYTLAVERDVLTSSIVAQEAAEAEDLVLL
jgi:cAMP-dependent protein kinase regulator